MNYQWFSFFILSNFKYHIQISNKLITSRGVTDMNIKDIKTKQLNKMLTNPKGKNYNIGLDIGYSATKVFFEEGEFCFPSQIKKINGEMIGESKDSDILVKYNNTIYAIGILAQDLTSNDDISMSENEMGGRKWYSSDQFKLAYCVALAYATRNKHDNKEIFIETGLPTAYFELDKKAITAALSKRYDFELKIGTDKWQSYSFEITSSNIHVIPQPLGTMNSIMIGKDGKYTTGIKNKDDIVLPEAKELLHKNLLLLDVGFSTFDYYGIKNRNVEEDKKISKDDSGMKAVLSEACKRIREKTGEECQLAGIQKLLDTGYIEVYDEENLSTEEVSIKEIINECNDMIFEKAFNEAKRVTQSFRGYEYIIVTGGTGEAWFEKFRDKLKNMKVKVLPGNIIDKEPMIFSNARGYYMYRYVQEKR